MEIVKRSAGLTNSLKLRVPIASKAGRDANRGTGGTSMAARKKRSGKDSRRGEILQAAETIMRSRGLTGVTTREISKVVGCSEGALYFHFKGRLELLLAMLEESLPDMLGPLQTLRESVGKRSPQGNLATALLGVF